MHAPKMCPPALATVTEHDVRTELPCTEFGSSLCLFLTVIRAPSLSRRVRSLALQLPLLLQRIPHRTQFGGGLYAASSAIAEVHDSTVTNCSCRGGGSVEVRTMMMMPHLSNATDSAVAATTIAAPQRPSPRPRP